MTPLAISNLLRSTSLSPARWRSARRVAFALAATLISCGLEVRNHTYQAEGKSEGEGPVLSVAATRTHELGVSESLTHGAPYRVSLTLEGSAEQTEPFVVRSVVFEHEGRSHVAHAAGAEPLVSSRAERAAATERMAVWVPLDGLAFVEGSPLTIKAEARLPGRTEWVTSTRTFRAVKEEKSYDGCQQMAMH